MRRVLMISDNPKLANAINRMINEKSLFAIASFDYCYSSSNKFPGSMIELGYKSIDLKEAKKCDWVIENFDLILSIHCKQIFPVEVVSGVCCINVHPGLNPYNRGWYPQVFSILNKKPIGATIHLMNEEIDGGPIIAQRQVEMYSHDTSLSLYERVQEAEVDLLSINITSIVSGDFIWAANPVAGNYNSVADFKQLCFLDIDAIGTLRDHIDLLRALSHGDFLNSYFIDEHGHKVYIKLKLELEADKETGA